MSQTSEFIQRVADRTGFKREFYKERNMPSTPSNVVIMPFYGDLRSAFTLSSLILRPYKELQGKYLILCSWPGMQDLFPYVDEYWCLDDQNVSKGLALEANNFYNNSPLYTEITQSLAESAKILTSRDLKEYYNFGFTSKYFETFNQIKRYLPEIPSANKLSQSFLGEMSRRSGPKVLVYPTTKMWSWQRNKEQSLPVSKLFWETLIQELLNEGYVPVVYQNWFTYDMSSEFAQRCTYLVPRNISDVLAAMRHVGLVLDIHSGISSLAMAARSPFLVVDERQRYMEHKGCEVDDLCCLSPKQYLWSFSSMLMTGSPSDWKNSIIDAIIAKLNTFHPTLEGREWGSTNESYENVSYDIVRQRKAKRLGVAFINSSKNK